MHSDCPTCYACRRKSRIPHVSDGLPVKVRVNPVDNLNGAGLGFAIKANDRRNHHASLHAHCPGLLGVYEHSGLTRIAGFTSTRISSYTAESGLASPPQDFVAGAGGKSLDGRV